MAARDLPFLSIDDLDVMTSEQRRTAFRERIVIDPSELPEDYLQRCYETARRVAQEHGTTSQ